MNLPWRAKDVNLLRIVEAENIVNFDSFVWKTIPSLEDLIAIQFERIMDVLFLREELFATIPLEILELDCA
jgi:hypothetical protein